MLDGQEKSSFRDRDGFVFYHGRSVYRAINHSYKTTWDILSTNPFFAALLQEKKLPSFHEVAPAGLLPETQGIYKVLAVEEIPFVSYPNEWSFNQLKQAALLTLEIQKRALQNNFVLKDASAYNIQFTGTRPVFIDLLSFDLYTDGMPWAAYGQFCRHFLGPLLLAANGLGDLQSLFVTHIDGLPLALVAKLLPWRTKFNTLAYTHIHLHSKFESRHAGSSEKEITRSGLKISKSRSMALLEHLEQGIYSLKLPGKATNWTDYYTTCSYNAEGIAAKKLFVEKQAAAHAGALCIDLGANTGEFSELAARYYTTVVACDSDAEVVRAIQEKEPGVILALRVNLDNPTPAYGWNGTERKSFIQRAEKADMVLALALIHHLCIGNNVPLSRLAPFFSGFAAKLVIEFVPKNDVQVKKLLVTRKDIFEDYSYENFTHEFSKYYHFEDRQEVPGSQRVLLLLTRK